MLMDEYDEQKWFSYAEKSYQYRNNLAGSFFYFHGRLSYWFTSEDWKRCWPYAKRIG